MFRSPFKSEPSDLDDAIDSVHARMTYLGPGSDEYSDLLDHLERLRKLKAESRFKRPDPNTIILVAGNLLGILVIVAYEQKHVMTSKGLGFVLKPQ